MWRKSPSSFMPTTETMARAKSWLLERPSSHSPIPVTPGEPADVRLLQRLVDRLSSPARHRVDCWRSAGIATLDTCWDVAVAVPRRLGDELTASQATPDCASAACSPVTFRRGKRSMLAAVEGRPLPPALLYREHRGRRVGSGKNRLDRTLPPIPTRA